MNRNPRRFNQPPKSNHPNPITPKKPNQPGSNNPNPPGSNNPNPPISKHPNPHKQIKNYSKVPALKPPESKPSISEIFNKFDTIFDQVADTLQIAVDEDLWPELKIEQNYPNLLEKNKETS